MRRIKSVLMVVAAMALMMVAAAAPAMADVFHNGHNRDFVVFNDNNDLFDHNNDDFLFCGSGVFDDFGNCGFFFPNTFGTFPGGVSQVIENEAESGDVDLSFSVG